jgi:predicted ArsR family transcriptional regulator
LEVLAAIRAQRRYLDLLERRSLENSRSMGATSSEIAEALGITRQGAYQKLKRLDSSTRAETPAPVLIPDLEPDTDRP